MVNYEEVVQKTKEAIKEAETTLPSKVIKDLKKLKKRETDSAKKQIQNILKNLELAQEKEKPICQDTGVPIFFVKIGRQLDLDFSLKKALTEATEKTTQEIPLRPSVVSPLERENNGRNTGKKVPIIDYELIEKNKLEITFLPKGAGSENVSQQKMMRPGDRDKLISWIKEKVKEAGPKPCPPLYLGIGIGGSFDYSTKLAKKALLDESNKKREKITELKQKILKEVNSLEIGPMGLGGKKTVLGVNIETAACHTASFPVALNIQCWANRKKTIKLE